MIQIELTTDEFDMIVSAIVYTVVYQIEVNGQSSEGEMPVEAESEARALEFAQAELEGRFPANAVLLECKIV